MYIQIMGQSNHYETYNIDTEKYVTNIWVKIISSGGFKIQNRFD